MIYLMYLSGIFILRISISLRPSWKHSHSLKLDSSTLKNSLDLNNRYTFSCTLARKTIRVEDSLVQVVSLSRANFRIDDTFNSGVFDMSEALILRANRYPEDEDKAQFTASRHADGLASSWQFCLWLWEMMCDHEIFTPKDDGKFIVISSASIHIAPGKEAVIYRRNDLKESPFVRWKTHQPLEKGHAEFGTKDQRMKMRPVSVNALVLRLLMGTSNGYFELLLSKSLDVTHQKKHLKIQ